jgi:ABC-2 type transport system ATP-binding protein
MAEATGTPVTTAATLSSVISDVSQTMSAVRVVGLAKKYGDTQAVRSIDLDIRRGEIFGLIGPDGAGKTTTFQILAGVMEASSGVAEIFGRPARLMRSQTGYLTQPSASTRN